MKRQAVNVPLSPLGAQLRQAQRLQRQLTSLLDELKKSADPELARSRSDRWRHQVKL